jgi:hypothetical protein
MQDVLNTLMSLRVTAPERAEKLCFNDKMKCIRTD